MFLHISKRISTISFHKGSAMSLHTKQLDLFFYRFTLVVLIRFSMKVMPIHNFSPWIWSFPRFWRFKGIEDVDDKIALLECFQGEWALREASHKPYEYFCVDPLLAVLLGKSTFVPKDGLIIGNWRWLRVQCGGGWRRVLSHRLLGIVEHVHIALFLEVASWATSLDYFREAVILQWYLRIRMLLLLRVLPCAWWTLNIWRDCWLLPRIDARCERGQSRDTASPSALSIFGRGGLVQFSLHVDPASI